MAGGKSFVSNYLSPGFKLSLSIIKYYVILLYLLLFILSSLLLFFVYFLFSFSFFSFCKFFQNKTGYLFFLRNEAKTLIKNPTIINESIIEDEVVYKYRVYADIYTTYSINIKVYKVGMRVIFHEIIFIQ